MLAAEVSNKTSPDWGRMIEKENGDATYLNWMFALFESVPSEAGRGKTDSGTW